MDELHAVEKNLASAMHQDSMDQNRNLDEKRKKRQQLLQIKKMQIEAD